MTVMNDLYTQVYNHVSINLLPLYSLQLLDSYHLGGIFFACVEISEMKVIDHRSIHDYQ